MLKQKEQEDELQVVDGPEADMTPYKKRKRLDPIEACMNSKCELKSSVFVQCDNCHMNVHQPCLKPKPKDSKSKHQLCF